MKTFKTAKGTELPLLNLKGKDYLAAQQRVLWMREEHPDWGIETEYLEISPQQAVAKATVRDASGRILAQGTKSETPAGFPDYIEKSETGAIGRALALCGYGTQFAQELDEGERILDAPQASKPADVPKHNVPGDPAAFIMPFGKYSGKRLDAIGPHDLNNYLSWLKNNKKPGERDTPAMEMIENFLKMRESKKQ